MEKLQNSLEKMQQVDIKTVKREDLVDIRDVEVNNRLDKERRMEDYIDKIGNPYCYCHDEYVVKIGFMDNGVSLTDRFRELILKTANAAQ